MWTVPLEIFAPVAGAVIARSGGDASVVTEIESVAELPARSYAVTLIVCAPSARPVNTYQVAVDGRTISAPPSTDTRKAPSPRPASEADQVTFTVLTARGGPEGGEGTRTDARRG